MLLQTKARLSRATLILLCWVAVAFILGVSVLTLCAGLNINPFHERATTLLFAAFFGLIGAAFGLFLLNVAINISIIADARISELPSTNSQASIPKKWIIYTLAAALLVTTFLVGSSYFSKKTYMSLVRSQAEDILQHNSSLLDQIATKLAANGDARDYKEISDILKFLQSQRANLPNITLLYSGTFASKTTYYQLTGDGRYSLEAPKPGDSYAHVYFSCKPEIDCEYIQNFFSGNNAEPMEHFSFRSDEFTIYLPYVINGKRFILLFARWNRYGKLGSSY